MPPKETTKTDGNSNKSKKKRSKAARKKNLTYVYVLCKVQENHGRFEHDKVIVENCDCVFRTKEAAAAHAPNLIDDLELYWDRKDWEGLHYTKKRYK